MSALFYHFDLMMRCDLDPFGFACSVAVTTLCSTTQPNETQQTNTTQRNLTTTPSDPPSAQVMGFNQFLQARQRELRLKASDAEMAEWNPDSSSHQDDDADEDHNDSDDDDGDDDDDDDDDDDGSDGHSDL